MTTRTGGFQRFGSGRRAYHRVTRTATYGFLAALPLILLYELLIVFVNRGRLAQVRVGAEVWLKQLLAVIGETGFAVVGGVVLAVGVAIFIAERKKSIPLRPRYFGYMVAESLGYAIVTAFLVSGMVGIMFAFAPVATNASLSLPEGLALQLALSIGAGIYEELLFRVLLVGGLFLLLKRFTSGTAVAYMTAAVIGAILFSAVHYVGTLGDVFTLPSFVFRMVFGLALNAIFLVRGFGVAAWTHALYDVLVVSGALG